MTEAGVRAQLAATSRRNVIRFGRNRGAIVGAIAVPVVFFVGIYVVFNDLMSAVGVDYAQYLTPAVMVEAVLFAAGGSALAMSTDVTSGLLDRMRAMPIATPVPAVGRLFADLVRTGLSIAVVAVLGIVCGFRLHGPWWQSLSALILLAAFAIASCLLYDAVAAASRSPEATTSVLQFLTLPLIMLSTAFVPVDTLPRGVAGTVEWLPVSVIIDALRGLFGGDVRAAALGAAIGWILVLAAVGITVGGRVFRRQR